MSFNEDVQKVLLKILDDCEGNKAAAAARLGVNPVTFWMWVEGKRSPVREALSRAIDAAGARLLVRKRAADMPSMDELAQRIGELERALRETTKERDYYKAKCDAYLEVISAQSGRGHVKTAPPPKGDGAEEKKNVA